MFKFKNAEKSRFITIFVYFSREAAIFSREIAFVSCEIAISSSTSRKIQKSLKIAIFRLKYTKIVKNRDFTRLNLNISGFTFEDLEFEMDFDLENTKRADLQETRVGKKLSERTTRKVRRLRTSVYSNVSKFGIVSVFVLR